MKMPAFRRAAFTLIEIMIVVAIIGLLAAIAVPNFVKARTASQVSACVSNLRQIEGAKAAWALEHQKSSSDVPAKPDLYGPALYIRDEPLCPAGGLYDFKAVKDKPSCTVSGHSY